MTRIVALGWKAHAGLQAAAGKAEVVAITSRGAWLTTGGELIWLGDAGTPLHCRAVLLDAPVARMPPPGASITVGPGGVPPWRPAEAPCTVEAAHRLREGCALLRGRITDVGCPGGLATLLVGAPLVAPPAAVVPAARAVAAACGADDAALAIEASRALLGAGPGLTPAGDDFTGAVFFARGRLAAAGLADREAWSRAGAIVAAEAPPRTHPVSAALLADLVEGQAYQPMHELADALAAGEPPARLIDAARRVAGIGHCSGWDLLTGLLAGVLGVSAFTPHRGGG